MEGVDGEGARCMYYVLPGINTCQVWYARARVARFNMKPVGRRTVLTWNTVVSWMYEGIGPPCSKAFDRRSSMCRTPHDDVAAPQWLLLLESMGIGSMHTTRWISG